MLGLLRSFTKVQEIYTRKAGHNLDMYVLSELKDTVRISPQAFNIPLNEAITDQLNRIFANRVIMDVGLGICVFDITKIGDSFINRGDGSTNTSVNFRFVMFRPFVNEVLVGKISSFSREEGVRVSLGFFHNISIPPHCLLQPSRFDETKQVWVWEYESDDGIKTDFFMDVGDSIRFKVKDEVFVDTAPQGPTRVTRNAINTVVNEENRKVPYLIIGTISEPGLGLTSWWE